MPNPKPPLTTSQILLRILGTLELLVTLTWSYSYLRMWWVVFFETTPLPYGNGFALLGLIILTPLLIALWVLGILSWRGKNKQTVWALQAFGFLFFGFGFLSF